MKPPKAIPNRPSDAGREAGAELARLADKAVERLAAQGEPDDRCKTCAFRAGTAPNGSAVTVSDAIKCVAEAVPFMCHHGVGPNGPTKICHGWYAARVALRDMPPVKVPFEFSSKEIKDLFGCAIAVHDRQEAEKEAREIGLEKYEWRFLGELKDCFGLRDVRPRIVVFYPRSNARRAEEVLRMTGFKLGWPTE